MSEILAPAGDQNSAFAAINAGADAIYLGLKKFSARSSAENFDYDNFKNICKYAHAFGVKVYAALNTAVKDSELESFISEAVTVWNSGADAIIIQDLFLGKFLKENFPEIVIHLSTQAGTCNALGAQLAKKYGFSRVILARETKLSDIAEISKIIETEVFVQGALCTCFSGQCYMSSFAGGNSGNRGKCKQPCRKKYSIDRAGFEEQAYRLSLSDLCVGESIEEYVKAGVTSFKIEGRMRRPEYVSAAVGYYKNQVRLSDLKRTFNRGNYTKGLSFGQDKSFISSAVQGHIGEFVGTVKVQNSKYICLSPLKFRRGDGFKILRGGREVGGGAYGGEAKEGFIIGTRDRLKNGDKVFITTDTALNERLLSKKRTLNVAVKIRLISGELPEAQIGGMKITGDAPLEPARTTPLSQDAVINCFKKVDTYPFTPDCEVTTDGVFMAASALNSFRRKVYSQYYEAISENGNKVYDIRFTVPQINIKSNTKTAVIRTVLNGVKADIGILKLNDLKPLQPNKINFNGEKYLYIPPFATGEEIQKYSEIAEFFDGIYCDNYFGIMLSEILKKPLFAGTGFNLTNRVSLEYCAAKYKCISKELTLAEADALSAENCFYLTDGNIKVMDLIYCPFERKCSSCDKRNEYTLTDGDGRKFPLRRYKTSECRFEVYNCADLKTDGGKAGRLTDRTLLTKPDGYTRGHSLSGIN